jgi:ABC-type branched-subunit amino acid transport system ATPase component
MLELAAIEAGYGGFQAVFGLSLEVRRGEAVAVIGPNGAGKTTGLTVLIVEQNVHQVLRVVDRAYLLEAGTIRASGPAAELAASGVIHEAYLGV